MKGGFKIIFSIASMAIIFSLIMLFPFLIELLGYACAPKIKVKGIFSVERVPCFFELFPKKRR